MITRRRLLIGAAATMLVTTVGIAILSIVSRQISFQVGISKEIDAPVDDGREDTFDDLFYAATSERMILVWDREYSNNPPVDAKTSGWHGYCQRLRVPTGEAIDTDPVTYPTKNGFALPKEAVWLSSHIQRTFYAVVFPHWFAVGLPATITAILVWLLIKPKLRPHGVCDGCGYDLRASDGRCPECGVVQPEPETSMDDRGAMEATSRHTDSA